mmetsp:Transcript_20141/g.63318  ORF Transcript_20141/g.63318 Transcript_20141/m.63318 type:complete len:476 (-) Transcript_20141:210-1637(-)
MREAKTVVVGNLMTLAVLAAGSAVLWLFRPYVATLLWAQLVAFSLRGCMHRWQAAQEEASSAAFKLVSRSVIIGTLLTSAAVVGVSRDAIRVGSSIASSRDALRNATMPEFVRVKLDELRPLVAEKAAPYVSGLFEDDCCQLNADAIVEAAGLAEDQERLARQAAAFLNAKLRRQDVASDDLLNSTAEAVKAKLDQDPGLKDALKSAAVSALSALAASSTALVGFAATLVATVLQSITMLVNALLFCLAVFAQLSQPSDWIETALGKIGCSAKVKRTLSIVSETLVVAPLFRGTAFALLTFLLVLLATGPCASTAAVVAFFAGVFPVLPAQLALLPQTLYFLLGKRYLTALALLLAHTLALSKVNKYFANTLSQHLQLPTSVVSLSYVLGVQRLGTQGLVLGPLLLALASQLFVVLAEQPPARTPSPDSADAPPADETNHALPVPLQAAWSKLGLCPEPADADPPAAERNGDAAD